MRELFHLVSQEEWAKSHEQNFELRSRFLPYSKAPVVVSRGQRQNQLVIMGFSLVPKWSKTPRVKFATHNARIETVLEKPTWKRPFVSQHCLVPISEFIESITAIGKKYAGNMVRFSEKNEQTLFAAGIYDEWLNQETGEVVETFAILTDVPPKFVEDVGHDRCPIFLQASFFDQWLRFRGTGLEAKEFLKSAKHFPDFKVEVDRPLKPGWEKRA